MTRSLSQRVADYLAGHTTFNIATDGPAGLWAAAILYVHDGPYLYFTSVASTRHGVNVIETHRCAGTINDDCRELFTMKGVQLEGVVEPVTDVDERIRVARAYLAKFPFAVGLWHGESDPEVIGRDPGIHGFFRIRPTKLFFTDNEHHPQGREELVS